MRAERWAALGFPRFPPAKSAPPAPPRRVSPRSPATHHLTLPSHTPPPPLVLLALWDSPSPPLASDDGRTPIPTTSSFSIPTPNRARPDLEHPSVPTAGPLHARAEMDGAADAALGAWASVRGFFTPATLFLVVNLVIGTIALTSRSHQRRRRGSGNGYAHHDDDAHGQHHQEQQPFHQTQHQENHYYDQQQHEHQHQYVPPPLARTSSVLDRLRSIGLYRFRSGDFPPEYAATTDSRDATFSPAPAGGEAHHERSRSEPAPMREERRKPAPPRMKKSSSEARRGEASPMPAARVVQDHVRAAVLEEHDDFVEEEEYAGANEEFTDSNFTTPQQPLPPAQHEEEQYYREEYVPPVRPAPLPRPPSVLERLRSFGWSEPAPVREETRRPAPSRMRNSSSSETWKAEVAPAPATRVARAAVLDEKEEAVEYARADEFADNSLAQPHEEEQYYGEEYVPPLRPAPLPRAPSVLERLRSFGLSRFRSGDLAHEQAAEAVAELERNQTQKQATQYSRSRSEPSREQSKNGKKKLQQGAEPKMSKSSSEARKPAVPEEAEAAEEGGVDARADDFINSFRKQLQLQRLNSLLNYKEMLNRGA